MSQTTVDRLIEERWTDVVGLVQAFNDFEERALETFENGAGPVVRAWLSGHGFEMAMNPKYAEFHAYKPEWLKGGREAVAKLTVGGLFPRGLAKVDTIAPYLWVYLRLDKPSRAQVAEILSNSVDSMWLHAEVEESQPLGRYLMEGDQERLKLVRDASAMASFAIAQFPDLLALEGRIDDALRAAGASG